MCGCRGRPRSFPCLRGPSPSVTLPGCLSCVR
nr:MAG TPA: hypothetical protein [Caudoviricetes sp.]DAH85972.1 MAG TPA: hypothetical protein [Caudoviricetes sp.]